MWLEILSGADAGRVVAVDRPLVLGRVQGADLVVRDARASRRHAELRPEAGGLRLCDLDSANGTLVDGQPARDTFLRGGEVVQIGAVRIAVLRAEPAPSGAVPAPALPLAPAGPSWSMVGRLVDARTRRGRRLAQAAAGMAGLALAALVALALAGVLDGGTEEDRVARAVRAAAPATLLVEARRGAERSATGSGWVLDADAGLVVTAAHVINQGDRFSVGGRPAAVVGVAPCDDLAVLRAPGLSAPALRLAGAGETSQGQSVLAFGFPDSAEPGQRASSTRGVVSDTMTRFPDPAPDVPAYPEAVRTDTALDPGFSGGPLVDLDGRVVGVNAAARRTGADGRLLQGANYAIAGDRVRRVLDVLRRGRSVSWTGIGFGYPEVSDLSARRLPEGLWIKGVVPGGGAARAGVRRAGELLVAVAGRPVGSTLSAYCRAVSGLPAGRSVALELIAADDSRRRVSVRFD